MALSKSKVLTGCRYESQIYSSLYHALRLWDQLLPAPPVQGIH